MPFIKRRPQSLPPKQIIDYKDIDLLKSFLSVRGKILPRRVTRLTLKQQHQLTKSVKRARILHLLALNSRDD